VTRRSLWIDEARISLNILGRSYSGLLRPLDYDQSASPGFLWLERISTSLFGVNELSLRLLPFLAGLLGLGLVYRISRDLLPKTAPRLLVLFWVACGPLLIYYSNEVKPYSLDMLIALLLIQGALKAVTDSQGTSSTTHSLLVLGAIAPWLSTPAVFTLAAALMALWVRATEKRAGYHRVLVLASVWGFSAAAAYWLVYRPASHNTYLHEYWSEVMIRLGKPGALGRIAFSLQDVAGGLFLGLPMQVWLPASEKLPLYSFAVLSLALVGLGTPIVLRQESKALGLLLLTPLGLAFLASCLGIYPFGFRLLMFAVPALLILAAAGTHRLLSGFGEPARWILWSFVLVVLCFVPIQRDLHDIFDRPRTHLRPAVEFYNASVPPSEPVYVFAGALPAWIYYTTNWDRPDKARLRLAAAAGSSGGGAFENASVLELPNVPDSLLTYRAGQRVEAFGRATGAQLRYSWAAPDTSHIQAWASGEARRIRELGSKVWLIVAHTPYYNSALYRELRLDEGKLRVKYSDEDVLVVYCLFGPTTETK
jgi:hypothetical protein